MKDNYAVVIGGANIDIGGTPYMPLVPADSNPGNINMDAGGVGCNIARTLSKLGVHVKFITALGDDHFGKTIIEKCEAAGIDMTHSVTIPGESSSMYLYINDDNGEMKLALSHMEIVNKLTPEYIDSVSDVILNSSAVVIDGNISHDTFMHIKNICKKSGENSLCTNECYTENKYKYNYNNLNIPIYFDPVSTAHAVKFKGCLDGINTIKPNRMEAEFLTDMTIDTSEDYKAAAAELIRQGVKRVFISMGPDGMIAADKDGYIFIESMVDKVVSTTGAGDSAMAAVIWEAMRASDKKLNTDASNAFNEIYGLPVMSKALVSVGPASPTCRKNLSRRGERRAILLHTSALAAMAAASITISSEYTISPELSAERIENFIYDQTSFNTRCLSK